ncbi:uncharacterized protein SOCE26_058480 [Sorangium cellulosum]|uniref:Secreted protein n=1 Tax=Sorangium cellulosum TaxID=56 RepID=A0A2L0EYJ4_SORCE|nr:hypothetical protein [Sorangium cellulosum]AUX44384.1 uncharacterized protein SOCE26_058480 [Sorangium cellulosum]
MRLRFSFLAALTVSAGCGAAESPPSGGEGGASSAATGSSGGGAGGAECEAVPCAVEAPGACGAGVKACVDGQPTGECVPADPVPFGKAVCDAPALDLDCDGDTSACGELVQSVLIDGDGDGATMGLVLQDMALDVFGYVHVVANFDNSLAFEGQSYTDEHGAFYARLGPLPSLAVVDFRPLVSNYNSFLYLADTNEQGEAFVTFSVSAGADVSTTFGDTAVIDDPNLARVTPGQPPVFVEYESPFEGESLAAGASRTVYVGGTYQEPPGAAIFRYGSDLQIIGSAVPSECNGSSSDRASFRQLAAGSGGLYAFLDASSAQETCLGATVFESGYHLVKLSEDLGAVLAQRPLSVRVHGMSARPGGAGLVVAGYAPAGVTVGDQTTAEEGGFVAWFDADLGDDVTLVSLPEMTPASVSVASDGIVTVAGTCTGQPAWGDCFVSSVLVVRLDPAGQVIWSKVLGRSGVTASAQAVASSKDFVAVGGSFTGSPFEAVGLTPPANGTLDGLVSAFRR